MLKNKSIDYIFGMITGVFLMMTFWACTQNPLNAGDSSSGTTGKYQAWSHDIGSKLINTQTGQYYYWDDGKWHALGEHVE